MKKYGLFLLIGFFLIIVNCKNKESKSANYTSTNHSYESINKEQQTDSTKLHVIESILKASEYINLGSKNLMFDFPENWSIYNDDPKKIKEKYGFESLQLSLANKTSLKITVNKHVLLDLLKKTNSKEIILDEIQNDNISINVSYLYVNKKKVYSMFFRVGMDCSNCEYGSYLDAKYFITINNKTIIDVLPVSFEFHKSISSKYKYFYVDNNVINTKSFFREEYDYDFLEHKKYILKSGKFIEQ